MSTKFYSESKSMLLVNEFGVNNKEKIKTSYKGSKQFLNSSLTFSFPTSMICLLSLFITLDVHVIE